MEYYLAIKNNDFIKLVCKCTELENIVLSEVTQSQKNTHGVYPLISGYKPKSSEYAIYSIHRPYEAKEGRPKCRCFHAS